MQLPYSIRESLVDEMDEYLESYGSTPDPEAVAAYIIELLEGHAEEEGVDDVVVELEESGSLDEPLQDVLEQEMSSNDEFEYTGEEVVSLLERTCDIEWTASDDDDDDDEDEGESDEDESDEDEEPDFF